MFTNGKKKNLHDIRKVKSNNAVGNLMIVIQIASREMK